MAALAQHCRVWGVAVLLVTLMGAPLQLEFDGSLARLGLGLVERLFVYGFGLMALGGLLVLVPALRGDRQTAQSLRLAPRPEGGRTTSALAALFVALLCLVLAWKAFLLGLLTCVCCSPLLAFAFRRRLEPPERD